MPSDIRRLVWNTRERLLSSDFNSQTSLMHRALIEAAHSLGSDDTERYGVLKGMTVSVVSSTLNVQIQPGLALMPGTAPTSYDTDVEWVEIASAVPVDLTAYVDGANPRWVCIELAPNDAVETTESRDQFNPATGTASSVAVTKVSGSSPTVTVDAGTAAATPALPAGNAGRLPLAYVYIPAGATQLTVGDTIGCRPLLGKTPDVPSLRGGGVSVPSNGSSVNLSPLSAEIPGCAFGIGLAPSTGLDIDIASDSFFITGQVYPSGAVNDILYLYALTAPYPSGAYASTLAAREFVPGSNIGTGARIPSLPAAVADSVTNCLVVVSTTAPADADDANASTFTSTTLNDPLWGGSVSPVRSVYLGAVTYRDTYTDLMKQTYDCGKVFFPYTNEVPGGADASVQNASSVTNQSGNLRLENTISSSGDQLIPSHAYTFDVKTLAFGNAGSVTEYSLSRTGEAAIQSVSITGTDQSHLYLHFPTTDGLFDLDHSETGSQNSTLYVVTLAYDDSFLARR